MNQAPSGAESSVKELTQRRQDAMGAKQKFLATSRLCVFALKISPPNMPPRRGFVPRPPAATARQRGESDGSGCRRLVRDLVFLVLVLQIFRADGAGDERRAKIILRWTFGAFGV